MSRQPARPPARTEQDLLRARRSLRRTSLRGSAQYARRLPATGLPTKYGAGMRRRFATGKALYSSDSLYQEFYKTGVKEGHTAVRAKHSNSRPLGPTLWRCSTQRAQGSPETQLCVFLAR